MKYFENTIKLGNLLLFLLILEKKLLFKILNSFLVILEHLNIILLYGFIKSFLIPS